EMHLRIKIGPARILRMTPIDHIDECAHAPLRLAGNEHVPPGLTVDHGDLLARAEISDGRGPRRAADPIGDAAAGATAVEAEHETGLFRRAAMDEGIDAQRPVQADEARGRALREVEAPDPHPRA